MRLTEAQKASGPIEQAEVFQHVPLLLAAITRLLCSRVLGARDGSFGTGHDTKGG
jgi:hypothetical protein